MAKETTTRLVFANSPGLAAKITGWLGDRFAGQPYCVVCVSGKKKPNSFVFDRQLKFSRALIVFEGLPINFDVVTPWREWAVEKGALDLHVTFLEHQLEEQAFKAVVERHCQHWSDSPPSRETPAVRRGQFVEMSSAATKKDDPSLLTMMFGSMGELLTAVDVVGKRFREACNLNPPKGDIIFKNYLEKIDALLDGKNAGTKSVKLDIPERVDLLPRLLLRGETGVGKTLVARYLHNRSGSGERLLRIPIPEYLGKEDMFEYDLFGYMRGAYTDAKEADRQTSRSRNQC